MSLNQGLTMQGTEVFKNEGSRPAAVPFDMIEGLQTQFTSLTSNVIESLQEAPLLDNTVLTPNVPDVFQGVPPIVNAIPPVAPITNISESVNLETTPVDMSHQPIVEPVAATIPFPESAVQNLASMNSNLTGPSPSVETPYIAPVEEKVEEPVLEQPSMAEKLSEVANELKRIKEEINGLSELIEGIETLAQQLDNDKKAVNTAIDAGFGVLKTPQQRVVETPIYSNQPTQDPVQPIYQQQPLSPTLGV